MQRSLRLPYGTVLYLLAICASYASAKDLYTPQPSSCLFRDLGSSTTCVPDSYRLSQDTQTVFESTSLELEFKLEERISLPVDNSTKSFWLDTPGANPLAEAGSEGELTEDADVCIVGSGITGVSTAWHLSKVLNKAGTQERTRVTILEARQFCSGATGRNGGHLTRNAFLSFLKHQARFNTSEAKKIFAIEQYTRNSLIEFITKNSLSKEVDLVEGGHVTVFRTEEEDSNARADRAAAKEAGLDVNSTWIGNTELIENYGLNPDLNYTGMFHTGHNVWPCKLVTQLFKDVQSTSDSVDISLHTKTPVTAITHNTWPSADKDSHFSIAQHRRWKLHTPRGNIGCSYVVHATNAYASHLLPFLAGIKESKLTWPSVSGEEHASQPPYPHPQPSLASHSRGLHGIVPTRGQVGAVRANSELNWLNAWDGGGGWQYWFPRYQDTGREGPSALKNPLVIVGGARHLSGGELEAGIADDSNLNPLVSTALRSLLPLFFPEQFVLPNTNQTSNVQATSSADGWEMEWSGIMAFTKDGDPFVGPVQVPQEFRDNNDISTENYYDGQYIAAGFSGHGMPRTYACAEAIAGMIKAQIRGEEWKRPYWLPEHYLTWATPS